MVAAVVTPWLSTYKLVKYGYSSPRFWPLAAIFSIGFFDCLGVIVALSLPSSNLNSYKTCGMVAAEAALLNDPPAIS